MLEAGAALSIFRVVGRPSLDGVIGEGDPHPCFFLFPVSILAGGSKNVGSSGTERDTDNMDGNGRGRSCRNVTVQVGAGHG